MIKGLESIGFVQKWDVSKKENKDVVISSFERNGRRSYSASFLFLIMTRPGLMSLNSTFHETQVNLEKVYHTKYIVVVLI